MISKKDAAAIARENNGRWSIDPAFAAATAGMSTPQRQTHSSSTGNGVAPDGAFAEIGRFGQRHAPYFHQRLI